LLTRLLRLLFVRPAQPPVDRERWQLAEGLDSLAKDAKPHRTMIWIVPPIIHPDVARACLPPARDLAAALRDPDADVDPGVVADVRWFLTDGRSSPLYGFVPRDAVLVLVDLGHRAGVPDDDYD
jgi:hypothetical protein